MTEDSIIHIDSPQNEVDTTNEWWTVDLTTIGPRGGKTVRRCSLTGKVAMFRAKGEILPHLCLEVYDFYIKKYRWQRLDLIAEFKELYPPNIKGTRYRTSSQAERDALPAPTIADIVPAPVVPDVKFVDVPRVNYNHKPPVEAFQEADDFASWLDLNGVKPKD